MSALSANIIGSIERALSTLGSEVIYERDELTIDATTGDVTSRTISYYQVNAAISNYTNDMINGDTIRFDDLKAYVVPFETEPRIGDAIVDSTGKRSNIINARRFLVNGVIVMFELRLRG